MNIVTSESYEYMWRNMVIITLIGTLNEMHD